MKRDYSQFAGKFVELAKEALNEENEIDLGDVIQKEVDEEILDEVIKLMNKQLVYQKRKGF